MIDSFALQKHWMTLILSLLLHNMGLEGDLWWNIRSLVHVAPPSKWLTRIISIKCIFLESPLWPKHLDVHLWVNDRAVSRLININNNIPYAVRGCTLVPTPRHIIGELTFVSVKKYRPIRITIFVFNLPNRSFKWLNIVCRI